MGIPREDDDDITLLLRRMEAGDVAARDLVFTKVHAQLRIQARALLRGNHALNSLGPSGLVNEAYLKLTARSERAWEGRRHFFLVAARAMRHVIVDHVRNRRRQKRTVPDQSDALDTMVARIEERAIDALELDRALEDLERVDAEAAQIVDLTFFGGMTAPEVSKVLEMPLRSVERSLHYAKAYLRRRLQ